MEDPEPTHAEGVGRGGMKEAEEEVRVCASVRSPRRIVHGEPESRGADERWFFLNRFRAVASGRWLNRSVGDTSAQPTEIQTNLLTQAFSVRFPS